MFFCQQCNFKYDDIVKNIDNEDEKKNKLDKNLAYFICNNCGFFENIKPMTMIYSKTHMQTRLVSDHNSDLIYDQTLPITKTYNCINKNCKTYTDINLKEAVFYKKNHRVTYICKICKSDWDI